MVAVCCELKNSVEELGRARNITPGMPAHPFGRVLGHFVPLGASMV
jgi:hypothetical protein